LRRSVAAPADNETVPIVAVPSLNITDPVGLTPATVAVSTTFVPTLTGLALAESVVTDGFAATVSTKATDVLGA
jgi:hypothetical protein